MSDEEETHSGDEETEEAEAEAKTEIKKRIETEHSGLDEVAKEILEANAAERRKMEQEIREMKKKNESRKKEREMEEKRLAQERAAEDSRRKAEEEDRKRKKEEEEQKKREARAKKTAEYEMMKNPPKRNFVISKKADTGEEEEKTEESADSGAVEKKSKEQLEAEKRAILGQRIQSLNIDGFDAGQLKEKAKELHALISRLESEKYDLEKRFKGQQFDMLELAEKARNMNKVGRGGLKRVDGASSESDKIAERFAGAPPRVVMYSEFERQKDKRSYGDRKDLYVGPSFGYPAERIKPTKQLTWGDDGLPQYVTLGGEAGGHGGHGEGHGESE